MIVLISLTVTFLLAAPPLADLGDPPLLAQSTGSSTRRRQRAKRAGSATKRPGETTPQDQAPSTSQWSIETKSAGTKRAELTFEVAAPKLKPVEWIIYLTVPPTLPSQELLSFTTSPKGEKIRNSSQTGRDLWRVRVKQEAPLKLVATYEATLFARKLTSAAPKEPVPPLSDRERIQYLAVGGYFDFDNHDFKEWIDANNALKMRGESEIDFARRLFLLIKKDFTYEYLSTQDRHASRVCQDRKSDCGGLATLYASILRSQKIPARLLVGRWAISEKPGERVGDIDYQQEHVKGEFFASGVGWIPFDLSSAILHDKKPAGLAYFGNDDGDFFTFHLDTSLKLDSIHFGLHTAEVLQNPTYWVTGQGSLEDAKTTIHWTVK